MPDDKPQKYKFEIDPWAECRGKDIDARKWAEGEVNVIKKFKFDLTPSKALNERKWPEKKVLEDAYYGKPKMAVIMFTQHIVQLKEDKKVKDKDKPGELKDLYKGLVEDVKGGVEDWLEEIASGKADNAGALKDGKAAMGKIASVEFKGAFDKPLKTCIDALKKVLKGGKVDPKELANAKKALEGVKTEMAKTAKEARNAIDFLLKTGKKVKDDKDAAASLKKFGRDVLQYKDEFKSFLGGADDFDIALDDALKAAGGEMDEDTLKDLLADFESLGPLEDAAQDCLKIAKQLAPQFKSIEKDLK